MKKKIILIAFLFLLAVIIYRLTTAGVTLGVAEVCPDSGEWTKIDSDDMTLHPVDGAIEYCYKDGDGRFYSDTPKDWKYNDEDEVVMKCRKKGLSHWSYRLGQVTPTPTVEVTPTDVPSPTPTVTPTITPTITPTATPTPKPTDKPEERWEEIRKIEGEVFGAQK